LRTPVTFPIPENTPIKQQLLQWGQQFVDCCWLDSNEHPDSYGNFEAVLAVGTQSRLIAQDRLGFNALENYRNRENDWIFGYLSYDLKNGLEDLESENRDHIEFPALYFFRPEKVILLEKHKLVFQYPEAMAAEAQHDYEVICGLQLSTPIKKHSPIDIKAGMSKEAYLAKCQQLLDHIHRGDVYEINFCQEFYASEADLEPLALFPEMNNRLQPPFASFLKMGDRYVLSASPERFLNRKGNTLISQPIKGTAKRHFDDPAQDAQAKIELENSEKERAENIMIVDLVRNDLSKVAKNGSVKVPELCRVYPYEQVHQMVSTVSAKIPSQSSPIAVIKAAFPMGSMTGAPKISAMELIERYETHKRGVYSGSVGYIDPQGDFDFNVIIRTLLYDKKSQKVSLSVGSALTALARPEAEYEECLLKAQALIQLLQSSD
jgi:para-aminobenzoate synthetase component 1